MSTSQVHNPSSLVVPSTFHPFPLLPYELRLKIWLFSFPPPSKKPLIRVLASPSVIREAVASISYTFKVSTDTTLPRATTTLEYLTTTFLKICTESRDLYIKTFSLTHALPQGILYNPSTTTIYVTNGLFLFPTLIPLFKSISTTPITMPPFFAEIQKLALPLDHFESTIFEAYDLRIMYDWPPSPGVMNPQDDHSYQVPTVRTFGSLFSLLTAAKHIDVFLPDDVANPERELGYSAIADARLWVLDVERALEYYKKDFCVKEGVWNAPRIDVVADDLLVVVGVGGREEGEDLGYDASSM